MKGERRDEFCIEIVAYADGKVMKEMGPYATHKIAERIDDGLNRNLNHERFFTRIVSAAETVSALAAAAAA